MSDKTLDYDSVASWMSLAVWASKRYEQWSDALPQEGWSDEGLCLLFFHEIALEALNRGFSLRAGHRRWAVARLLKAIAPENTALLTTFYRVDKEEWLTPTGARLRRKERK